MNLLFDLSTVSSFSSSSPASSSGCSLEADPCAWPKPESAGTCQTQSKTTALTGQALETKRHSGAAYDMLSSHPCWSQKCPSSSSPLCWNTVGTTGLSKPFARGFVYLSTAPFFSTRHSSEPKVTHCIPTFSVFSSSSKCSRILRFALVFLESVGGQCH